MTLWLRLVRKNSSPSMRREWIEITQKVGDDMAHGSPSMRREWIEITIEAKMIKHIPVSLHAEGVD